ncbi:hypothetical protein [Fulvimarina sp. MAC3]|uniref:Abi-alpha family protein n=1 Tax=Fulvimarina sp. MAC3 TaxID=3148887 RepID=UPI0031FDCD97
MTNQHNSDLKLDVGLGARAELKAEVPPSSMGRLVDALTDAIRPFTEQRGLNADRVRLQREEVLIEIAKKARQRLEIEGRKIDPIPLRVLHPLLEKASLTENEDEIFIETWANILYSASRYKRPNHLIFIDLLSKLDAPHLRYLEYLCDTDRKGPADEFLLVDRDSQEILTQIIDSNLSLTKYTEENHQSIEESIWEDFRVKGLSPIAGSINFSVDTDYFFDWSANFAGNPDSIGSALETLNLVKRSTISNSEIIGISAWLDYHCMTMFGLEFFYTCQGRSSVIEVD